MRETSNQGSGEPRKSGSAREGDKSSPHFGASIEEVNPTVRPPGVPDHGDEKQDAPSLNETPPRHNRQSGQSGQSGRQSGRQSGKIGWALLWLLGIPLPVLIIIYLIRGH